MLEAMPKVRRAAMAWTRDVTAAEDLVQDALVKALGARDSFQLGTNMGAWVCFIARNVFFTQKRRSWRWQQMPTVRDKSGEEVEDIDFIQVAPNQHNKLELDDLLEAIGYLPADQREAILLIGEGLSYDEVAGELGVTEGTVKSRVSRGRVALGAYFNINHIEEFA